MSPTTRQPRARAFTLIEAVCSIAIVSIMLVAAINVAGSAVAVKNTASERSKATTLAQDLLAEITSQPWTDPNGDETDEDRSTWDDVDDYNGLSETPPADSDGNPVPGYTGWTRSAAVTTGFNGFSGLKTITVKVASPNGLILSISALRSKRSSLDRTLQANRTYIGRVNISIQTGSDVGTLTTTSVNPVNQIP